MNNLEDLKQVIVWQNALKCRRGKQISQCCHASLKAILDSAFKTTQDPETWQTDDCQNDAYIFSKKSYVAKWLSGIFTKITVRVESEDELIALYEEVTAFNYLNKNDIEFQPIPVALIKDAGLTEFHGVPTLTCMAVGPAPIEVVNKFTGHLKLL
jgi:peptidyl-tRNA hydrolase, PTH2 family